MGILANSKTPDISMEIGCLDALLVSVTGVAPISHSIHVCYENCMHSREIT